MSKETALTFTWIKLGAIAGILACAIYPLMVAVEMPWIGKVVDKVQLGLDVSWDVFISVGTFLLALNMLNHPRFGKILGGVGALLAVLLLGFNLYSFPIPPANANLIDFGPFVGLWYLIVSIQTLRSLVWAKNALENQT